MHSKHMGGLAMNRIGPTVGLARALPPPRSASRLCRVRAGSSDAKKPVVYRELPGVSGKYVVNYTGDFNKQFKKRLLCIDGGGVRGLVPATVLVTVEQVIAEHLVDNYAEHLPPGITAGDIEVDVADYFDIISGTSVGSIVALYMGTKGGQSEKLLKEIGSEARPGSAQAVADIIYNKAGEVFPAPLYEYIPVLGGFLRQFLLLFAPKFNPNGLEQLLQTCFGEMTLKEADTKVLVPAFNISQNVAQSFWGGEGVSGNVTTTNHVDDQKEVQNTSKERRQKMTEASETLIANIATFLSIDKGDGEGAKVIPDVRFDTKTNYKLWQVARASAAAPTFFPGAKVDPIGEDDSLKKSSHPSKDIFVDGGVIANNPTLQALSMAQAEIKQASGLRPNISEISILSLGTGSCLPDTRGLKDAGALQWFASGALIGTMMDGTSRYLQVIVDDLYNRLDKGFPEQYVRVDDIDDYFEENASVLSEMDNPKNVEELKKIGERLGARFRPIIRSHVDLCLHGEEVPSTVDS